MSISQQVKDRLDIVDVLSPYVQLKKAGRNYQGFCPFHANTRTPAFYVFPETQTWHCFGACAEGGDVFSFMMKREGWEFKEALKELADRAGVKLEPASPQRKQAADAADRLTELLEAAADYFHQLLYHAPEAEAARQYVRGRALRKSTVDTFKLGFALNSWDACRNHFAAQGYTTDDLLAVGLLTENEERQTTYDRFRNRLMIPIRDVRGRTVGFGARTLDPDGIPKYLNTSQTTLFDKGRLLFGLDLNRRTIRDSGEAVIVEGYMDVMQAWQSGFRNVVAQMGTSLTGDQVRQLQRYARRFVIALDADEAGARATLRSLDVARENLERDETIRFDARGLARFEGRTKAEICVMTLPAGMDPDDFIRERKAEWPTAVASARPIIAYVIDVLTQDLDMGSARAKAEVAEQVAPLIREMVNPVERDHYWQLLSRALAIESSALRTLKVKPRRSTSRATTPARVKPKAGLESNLREANFLYQCLRAPRLLRDVNRLLVANQQPALREEDFNIREDRSLFNAIQAHESASAAVVWENLTGTARARAEELQQLSLEDNGDVERVVDRLTLSVLAWREASLRAETVQLSQAVGDARAAREDELVEMLLHEVTARRYVKLSLDRAKRALMAAGGR